MRISDWSSDVCSSDLRGSPRLKLANSLSYDGVHIIRGALTPNEDGKIIGGSQLSIAIHVGDPIDLEWSEPGSDRVRVTRVEPRSEERRVGKGCVRKM